MSDRTLCLWRKNDQITAQRLNQMTCAINANTTRSEENSCKIGSLFDGSYNAVSGLPNERYISGLGEQFMQQNRGFIIDEWDYCGTPENTGVYVRESGYENAQSQEYPDTPCLYKLASGTVGNETKEIMQVISTDEYGKVKESKIELMTNIPPDTKLWQGPEPECGGAPLEYKFYRRLGRVVNACYEYSEGSTPINKVMETNDLVMPILPARAEAEKFDDAEQTASLIGDFKDNSVLIKNIKNGGGLKLTPNKTNLEFRSGIEFHKACVTESSDSSSGETTQNVSWPDIEKHVEPQPFDVVIACIPVKEQHYKWCKTSNSWVTSYECGASSCVIAPCDKGSIKITAKSLCGNNWQIGWVSSGEIEIPVKDFDLTEGVSYEAGRGISICKQSTTDDEGNIIDKSFICNTMKICAGCGIKITESESDKALTYKIEACKMKLEAGDGIKVECIQGGYKVSACKKDEICINAGTGISVTKSNNAYTITNTSVHEPIVVSAGNGIEVSQVGNNYTVSVKAPCSTCCVCICGVKYSFDPAWFIVTDTNVTINEAKINEVAAGIAPNVSSQITSTATAAIDTWTDETGYKGYSGNINATIVTECGTAATASVTSSRN